MSEAEFGAGLKAVQFLGYVFCALLFLYGFILYQIPIFTNTLSPVAYIIPFIDVMFGVLGVLAFQALGQANQSSWKGGMVYCLVGFIYYSLFTVKQVYASGRLSEVVFSWGFNPATDWIRTAMTIILIAVVLFLFIYRERFGWVVYVQGD